MSVALQRGIADPSAKVVRKTLGQHGFPMFSTEAWEEDGQFFLFQPDLDLLVAGTSPADASARLGELITDKAALIEGLDRDDLAPHEIEQYAFIVEEFVGLSRHLQGEVDRLGC